MIVKGVFQCGIKAWLLAALVLVSTAAQGQVLYMATQGNASEAGIWMMNADGSNLRRIIAAQTPTFAESFTEIVVDRPTLSLYISGASGKLYRSDLDGANLNVITTIEPNAQTFAFDDVHRKLYYNDTEFQSITRSNVDGTMSERLPLSSLSFDAVADGAAGYLFYSTGELRRVDLNAANRVILFDPTDSFTSSVAVDPIARKIYWSQTGGLCTLGQTPDDTGVYRSNYDGSNREAVIPFRRNGLPPFCIKELALDPLRDRLYWHDPGSNLIGVVTLNVLLLCVLGGGAPIPIALLPFVEGLAID